MQRRADRPRAIEFALVSSGLPEPCALVRAQTHDRRRAGPRA